MTVVLIVNPRTKLVRDVLEQQLPAGVSWAAAETAAFEPQAAVNVMGVTMGGAWRRCYAAARNVAALSMMSGRSSHIQWPARSMICSCVGPPRASA